MNLVTVIVPVYNMSRYIDKCVQSVMEQTYKNYVLLLIDDGSVDDSLEKCIRWRKADSRIVVLSKTNAGLGPTRNMGIKMVESEYVSFLDADDWWHPEYLRLMLDGTNGGKNDLILCDMNFVQETPTGELESRVSALRFKAGALDLAAEWNLINRARTFMCGKLYRKSLFLKYGVEQPAHTYEDVATTPYLVARAKSIYHVPKGLYFYLRNRQGSIVNNFSSLYGLLQSLEELFLRFQKEGLLKRFYPSLRQLFWGQLVFIHRSLRLRFVSADIEKKERIWTDAVETVCTYFPELNRMLHWTFSVPSGDTMLIRAMRLLLVDGEQLLEREGDFVIVSQGERGLFVGGKEIAVHNTRPSLADEERALWDMADEIFRALWEYEKQ